MSGGVRGGIVVVRENSLHDKREVVRSSAPQPSFGMTCFFRSRDCGEPNCGFGDSAATMYRALTRKPRTQAGVPGATGDLLLAGAGWLWVVVGGVVEPVEGGFVAGLGGVFLFFVVGGFGV